MNSPSLSSILATRITSISLPHPVRVAIDGVDASGKTTLADDLAGTLRDHTDRQVLRATLDHFHNPRAVRYRQCPDSPDGYYTDSFNLPDLRQNLLDPLGPGGSRIIRIGRFDGRIEQPLDSPPQPVSADAILIFDGVFLLRPELVGCWDFFIFLQVTFETVLARAIQRDQALMGSAQAIIDRYTQRYIPAQRRYLESARPAEYADVVIDNNDPQHPIPIRSHIPLPKNSS